MICTSQGAEYTQGFGFARGLRNDFFKRSSSCIIRRQWKASVSECRACTGNTPGPKSTNAKPQRGTSETPDEIQLNLKVCSSYLNRVCGHLKLEQPRALIPGRLLHGDQPGFGCTYSQPLIEMIVEIISGFCGSCVRSGCEPCCARQRAGFGLGRRSRSEDRILGADIGDIYLERYTVCVENASRLELSLVVEGWGV